MGSKDSPDPPDYRGAAVQEGEAAKEIARQTTFANRPDQYTPWGNSTWQTQRVTDPATGLPTTRWQQSINLSGPQQQALDSQMNVQAGRSALAQSLIGRSAGELEQPMDWNALPGPAQAPDVPGFYGANLPTMGNLPNPNGTDPTPPGAPSYGGLSGWGNTPGATTIGGPTMAGGMVPNGRLNDPGIQGQSLAPNTYSPTGAQAGLDFSGAQSVDAGGAYQDRFANQQFERNMSLLRPEHERATESLDVQLRNRGLTPGTEAYDYQMNQLRQSQDEAQMRLAADAVRYGGQEQQAQFGREMSLRGQQVGETTTQGQFTNQALQQQFGQQLQSGAQGFGEQSAASQFAEQQRAARLGQQGQQFGQQLQQAQAWDNQVGQNNNTRLAWQGQQFGQNMQAAQQANALRGQQFGELQQLQQYYGGQAEQQFRRQLDLAQFQDSQRQQVVNEQLAFGQQGFNQQLQQANYQNTLRQQAIAEEAQRRGLSINEMNALMTGQQVASPGMPQFMGASQAQAPQYLAAAQAQGQFDAQNYSTALGPVNALLGSFQLGR